jgi:hypothetical protein
MSGLAAREGWEWQDLQEAQSRSLRERALEASDENLDEYIEAFDSELSAKNEKIENLELLLEIEKAKKSVNADNVYDFFPESLKGDIGPELYDGEFFDRLRSFVTLALNAPSLERNDRTDEFVKRFLKSTKFSGRSATLVAQIKTACRDGNQMPSQLGSLLTGFGFKKDREDNHLIYKPPSDLFGLPAETLPSTPSDSQRGGKNRGSEVIRNFGLNDLR